MSCTAGYGKHCECGANNETIAFRVARSVSSCRSSCRGTSTIRYKYKYKSRWCLFVVVVVVVVVVAIIMNSLLQATDRTGGEVWEADYAAARGFILATQATGRPEFQDAEPSPDVDIDDSSFVDTIVEVIDETGMDMNTTDVPFQEIQTRSRSTRNNHGRGWALWDTFALLQGISQSHDLTDDILRTPTFQGWVRCFCSFLVHYKAKNGQPFKPDTITQYLSSFKSALSKRHPSVTQIQTDHLDSKWYSDVFYAAEREAHLACSKRGDSHKEQKGSLQHVLLERICRALLDDSPGNQPSYEAVAALVMLYQAIGRGSEVSLTAFNLMRWDTAEESLWALWSELKVASHQTDLPFFCNAVGRHYSTDIFFVLGVYLVVSGALLANSDKLFKNYSDLSDGGAASKLSREIRKCVGRVEGLEENHTSHSVRIGAIDDLAICHYLPIVAGYKRAAWEFSNSCVGFLYLTSNVLVLMAGKSIVGYTEPRQKVSAPTLDALPEEYRERATQLCRYLFGAYCRSRLNTTLSLHHLTTPSFPSHRL